MVALPGAIYSRVYLLHLSSKNGRAPAAQRKNWGKKYAKSLYRHTYTFQPFYSAHLFPSWQSAVIDLLGRVCGVLPASVKDQCEGLIENYGKRLLDLLLSYATPQAICSIIHMCKGQETQMFVGETPFLSGPNLQPSSTDQFHTYIVGLGIDIKINKLIAQYAVINHN